MSKALEFSKMLVACVVVILIAALCASCTAPTGEISIQAGVSEPVDRNVIAVIYTDGEGSEHEATVNLVALKESSPKQPSNNGADAQEGLGYLYRRVYEDDMNALIATDNYVLLSDVLNAPASEADVPLDDYWYPGCTLEFTVGVGRGENYRESTWHDLSGYQGVFSYEKLVEQERVFFPAVAGNGPLFNSGQEAVLVPTVIALSTAREEIGIPNNNSAGSYLSMHFEKGELDIRTTEFAPQLLWGLLPGDENDITEYRFPTNIVRIRIIPPGGK